MTSIYFTKMHGLGNDFVIIDTINSEYSSSSLPITLLANRYVGIGFDQLLLIERATQADFFCRIFNSDGSEAKQCGNGLRCVARYLHENKLVTKSTFHLETIAGIYPVYIKDYDHIQITMGAPDIQHALTQLNWIDENLIVEASVLSVGNSHAIVKVEEIDKIHTNELGPLISSHPIFSDGANVGFMQILSSQHIRLRTYERGAGETNACGSNACAAVVAGITNGWLADQVKVEFKLGALSICWEGGKAPIQMIGPATRVFIGELRE